MNHSSSQCNIWLFLSYDSYFQVILFAVNNQWNFRHKLVEMGRLPTITSVFFLLHSGYFSHRDFVVLPNIQLTSKILPRLPKWYRYKRKREIRFFVLFLIFLSRFWSTDTWSLSCLSCVNCNKRVNLSIWTKALSIPNSNVVFVLIHSLILCVYQPVIIHSVDWTTCSTHWSSCTLHFRINEVYS